MNDMRTRLKALRVEKGLTQRQLAEKAALSLSYYTEIELGKKQMNERRLKSIAKALGVSTFDILEPDEVDQSIENLVTVYSRLDEDKKAVVLEMVRALAASNS